MQHKLMILGVFVIFISCVVLASDDDWDPSMPPEEVAGIKEMYKKWPRSKPLKQQTARQRKYLAKLSGPPHSKRNRGRKNKNGRPKRQTTAPKVRREYRNLTDSERIAFHVAVQTLKNTVVDGESQFDALVNIHNFVDAPGAHRGASFLPWHRHFLYMFEKALQEINENVTLPYWDSCNEKNIGERHIYSALYDSDTVGNTVGRVTSGPFADFPIQGECMADGGDYLTRGLRQHRDYYFRKAIDVELVTQFTSFSDIAHGSLSIEQDHGGLHYAMGGHMGQLNCSPFDPMFWMHHCFVDYLWERMRENQFNNNVDSETDYPSTYYPYRSFDPMKPFTGIDENGNEIELTNSDGMQDWYTEDVYTYQRAPCEITCSNDEECGGSRLYCESSECRAKVREGGQCGSSDANRCFCATGTPSCNWYTQSGESDYWCTCS